MSPTGTLWGGGIIGGDPDPILLQSVKSLSSDGAGVGGVLGCQLCALGEEMGALLLLLSSLAGSDHSSVCLYLTFLSKGPWE